MIVCIWCICLFWQSTTCHRALCTRQGPWERGLCGVLVVTAERLWKNRWSCCATLKWELSGRRWRLQKELKTNWKCELQLHALPQPQSPRTLSFTGYLRDPLLCLQHISNSREAMGPKLHFYHKPLYFSTKAITKPMCRLIGVVVGFQKRRSVCDLVIIASAKVIFVKV